MNGAKSPKEIGEILKSARQKKGVTIEKAYNATRIQPSVIEALEAGSAEDTLSKIYMVLFLKKYASFLDLDGDRIAKDYKAFYAGLEEKKQVLDPTEKPKDLEIDFEKWFKIALPIGLTVLALLFLLFSGIKIRRFFRNRKVTTAQRKKIVKAEQDNITKSTLQVKTSAIFPIIPFDEPIVLDLKAGDDVWMRVKKDGKFIFEGTLKKGDNMNWSAENSIELWAGRAEALDFMVNGASLGKVGRGNIKDIKLSKDGLKIKNKWLLKAPE